MKTNIDLAKIFIQKGGSFNLLSKIMRNNKSVPNNSKNYHHLNKKLKDDDEILEIVVKLDKKVLLVVQVKD